MKLQKRHWKKYFQKHLGDYDPSRSKAVPLRLLEGYSSYLQADGYAGYEAVCRQQGITLAGCWDHARRKFKDAQDAQPRSKKGGHPRRPIWP